MYPWQLIPTLSRYRVPQVKSKSASLVTGSNRFVIELYDTSTEHDVIISQEMVATGNAQLSPERTKVCLDFYKESGGNSCFLLMTT